MNFGGEWACIPAVVALVALAAAAVLGLIFASAKWDWGVYKLWPHDTKPDIAAAVIAGAKTRRYFWIPGFHVFVCRTTLFNADDRDAIEKSYQRQNAVRNALIDLT